jgi:hypothetical protein
MLLSDALDYDLAVTSHYRDDRTAHRLGVAIDLAPRSGSGFARKLQGECPYYYYDANFIRRAIRAAEGVNSVEPTLRKVLIETDHIHVEIGPPGPVRVGIYAPEVHNSLCDTVGISEDVQWLDKDSWALEAQA